MPKDPCSLADDFLRSAGTKRTIAVRGLCFKGHATECPPVQTGEAPDLAPLYTSSDPAPDTSSSSSGFSFCLSSWNSGGTMVFSSFSHPAFRTWDSEDSPQMKQLGRVVSVCSFC